jgi:hypothetical protein
LVEKANTSRVDDVRQWDSVDDAEQSKLAVIFGKEGRRRHVVLLLHWGGRSVEEPLSPLRTFAFLLP